MPNDQQGVKLPLPPKSFKPDAHDEDRSVSQRGRQPIHSFTDSEKSPAKADRVVKGLRS